MVLFAYMHLHTEASKKKMSEQKRLWWGRVKKDPVRLAKVKENISRSNAKNQLGKKGHLSTNWKGGRFTTKRDGYVHVYVPNHPFARHSGKGGGGYVLEHRLVMEKIVGRYLNPDEDVNHINGDKKDNRPENLRLVRHHAHYEEHKCPRCEFEFWTR